MSLFPNISPKYYLLSMGIRIIFWRQEMENLFQREASINIILMNFVKNMILITLLMIADTHSLHGAKNVVSMS